MAENLKSIVAQELKIDKEIYDLAFGDLPNFCDVNQISCVQTHRERLKRSGTSPDMSGPAVMYLPLGGSAPPGCPSIAESAVTGISQVIFQKNGQNDSKN